MPLPIVSDIRKLAEWAPLLGYSRRFSAAATDAERNIVIGDALEWLASKTASRLDDELAGHVAAILMTAEGVALVRWLTDHMAAMEGFS